MLSLSFKVSKELLKLLLCCLHRIEQKCVSQQDFLEEKNCVEEAAYHGVYIEINGVN